MKILCPTCKGKGKVFDKMSLLLTVGLPMVWIAGADELTHKECPQCEGECVITIKDD
jgi:DnaJ-class molecular chaperone